MQQGPRFVLYTWYAGPASLPGDHAGCRVGMSLLAGAIYAVQYKAKSHRRKSELRKYLRAQEAQPIDSLARHLSRPGE